MSHCLNLDFEEYGRSLGVDPDFLRQLYTFKDGEMEAIANMVKYTNNSYKTKNKSFVVPTKNKPINVPTMKKTFDVVQIKNKILENFKNSASARLSIQPMEINKLIIKADSRMSIYLQLAGMIYVSQCAVLGTVEPSDGINLLNALVNAFGRELVDLKHLCRSISTIVSCFPYIACEAHQNGWGKIECSLPYDDFPKCMLTKHFLSIIPKVLLKSSSPEGACCIHALIFVALQSEGNAKDIFKSLESAINSLAVGQPKRKQFGRVFDLTIGVFGDPSYGWNDVAWNAFKKTRDILCEREDDKAKELYNLAETWRKS